VPLIEQSAYMVRRERKQDLLEHLLADRAIARALVFTRTKHGADRVTHRLVRAGIPAQAIHGNKAQNQRQRALEQFRTGRSRVLVATDVAARGLDVEGITHVFNFDVPHEPEAYVHRIGRTGRAGAAGVAISFCDHEERPLLRDIESLTGRRVPVVKQMPDLPEPVRTPPFAEYGEHRRSPHARSGRAHRGSHRTGETRAGDTPRPSQSVSREHPVAPHAAAKGHARSTHSGAHTPHVGVRRGLVRQGRPRR
jgi:ATP-dependent RNA helicase RhlE